MQLDQNAFPFPYAVLKSPFSLPRDKKSYFSTYTCPTSYTTCIYVGCTTTACVHQLWWYKLKIVSGFHVTSRDPWSLTFHILETFWLDPSVPFEGYKWDKSKLWKRERIRIQLWEKSYSGEIIHFILSLHPFVLLSLNTLFIPQDFPYLIENLIVSLIWALFWWRIKVVGGQLEGI